MLSTQVGYAGGNTNSPTYHDLEKHAEAVEIRFDADRLSLEKLLELVWAGHDPTRVGRSSQYRSALFAQDEEQLTVFRRSADREAAQRGRAITTEIVAGAPFYAAEAYHQKWYLRRHPQLLDELVAHYSGEREALASTAAARLNGYLGGAGTAEQLERDIDRLGLSDSAKSYLRKTVSRWG